MIPRLIPDRLAAKYRGAGYAIAAITRDEIIDLRYLRDILPDEDFEEVDDEGNGLPAESMRRWLSHPKTGKAVREMQAFGEIVFGMVSSWEFLEL